MVWLAVGLVLLASIILAVSKITALGRPNSVKDDEDPANMLEAVPTLFIPGYFGNRFSFGRLLNRMTKRYGAHKSMVVRVDRHGNIHVSGTLSKSKALIQVLFAKKTSRPQEQAVWLSEILDLLQTRYGIQEVNLVGHSMGCITIFWFLTHQSQSGLIAVKHVVAIAGPFNDSEIARSTNEVDAYPLSPKGPVKRMPIYRALAKRIFEIPKDIKVLNIAGRISNLQQDDGEVSVNSAFSLRYLLREPVAQYHELVIRGKRASHRLLHENAIVDASIAKFIWNL